MATRLRKEARELVPVLLSTLVLMAAPGVIWSRYAEAVSVCTLFVFGVGCAVMGGMTFGSEFQHQTLGLLLAQPVRRSVLWWEKMTVLGAGLLVSLVMVFGCLMCASPDKPLPLDIMAVLVLMPLCAFCGAPYLTLATRSTLSGSVFAALLPLSVGGLIGAGVDHWWPRLDPEKVMLASVLVYCPLVYWRGHRRFRNLELKDGTAGDIALPQAVEGLLARGAASVLPGVTGAWAALLKKEFRLQLMSFLMAGMFTVLVLLAGLVRLDNLDVGDALLSVEFAIYVIILPFIIGAMSVAEERSQGLAEWQLSLPTSPLKQWVTKMAVTLPASTVLGLLLPWALLVLSVHLCHWPAAKAEWPPVETAAGILVLQALVTAVAVYAASASGSTIRAILQALGLVVAGAGLFGYMANRAEAWAPDWRWRFQNHAWSPEQWALACAAGVLMLLFLQWLAFRNFRRCGASGRRVLVQVTGILLGWTLLIAVILYVEFFIKL